LGNNHGVCRSYQEVQHTAADQHRGDRFSVGSKKVFAGDGNAIRTRIGGDLRNHYFIPVEFVDLSESVQTDRHDRQQDTEHDAETSHGASTPGTNFLVSGKPIPQRFDQRRTGHELDFLPIMVSGPFGASESFAKNLAAC
jgi:hypothetical protein